MADREAVGLRHEDWAVAERELSVVPRLNANDARTKSATSRTIPVSAELIRLYADYMHIEYGDLDSDYVFVSLWAAPQGHAMTYAAVHDLVRRLRRKTGIDYDPHWHRHAYATRLLRGGTPVEVVSKLLGHVSLTTTTETYGHLTAEDARKTLGRRLVRRHGGAAVIEPALASQCQEHAGFPGRSCRTLAAMRSRSTSVPERRAEPVPVRSRAAGRRPRGRRRR